MTSVSTETKVRVLFGQPGKCSDLSWLDHVGAIAIELHDYLTPGCARAFFSAVTPRMASCITSNEIALVTLLEPETLC